VYWRYIHRGLLGCRGEETGGNPAAPKYYVQLYTGDVIYPSKDCFNYKENRSCLSIPLVSNTGRRRLWRPELVTVKAARYLQQAEIVLADRL